MTQNNPGRAPGEAEGDGTALHGPKTEVTWGGGQGRQPYANQGEEEQGPGTAKEPEAGDRGERSGNNLEQLEEVKRKP
jgi:hypothetical protein